ncbi:hypothetical protein KW805_02020 [Candidatus Pacearchaeota archaeon]|nr:hypothetical protein [Candidatus Pacearchaeota archaeon]
MKRAGVVALFVVCSLLAVSCVSAFWPLDKLTGLSIFSHKAGPIEQQLDDIGVTPEQLKSIIGDGPESNSGGFDVWDPTDLPVWSSAKTAKHYLSECTGKKETLKLPKGSIDVYDSIETPGQEFDDNIFYKTFSSKQLGSGFCIKQKITIWDPKKTVTSARWVSLDGYPQVDIRYPFVDYIQSYTETTECNDNDQGINFHKAGVVKWAKTGESYKYYGDSCDGDTIVEAVCQRQTTQHGDGSVAYITSITGKTVGPGRCVPATVKIDGKTVKSARWVDNRAVSSDVTACDDTDGGKDYDNKGVTFGIQNYHPEVMEDVCTTATKLKEYSCLNESASGSNIVETVHTCQNGCNNGACVVGSGSINGTTTAPPTNTPPTNTSSADARSGGVAAKCTSFRTKSSCNGASVDSAKLEKQWNDFSCGKTVLGKSIQCGCYWEESSDLDSSAHCTIGPATNAANLKGWFKVDSNGVCIEKAGSVNVRTEALTARAFVGVNKCTCTSDLQQTLAPGKNGQYLCLKK